MPYSALLQTLRCTRRAVLDSPDFLRPSIGTSRSTAAAVESLLGVLPCLLLRHFTQLTTQSSGQPLLLASRNPLTPATQTEGHYHSAAHLRGHHTGRCIAGQKISEDATGEASTGNQLTLNARACTDGTHDSRFHVPKMELARVHSKLQRRQLPLSVSGKVREALSHG
jgi:hypothetical protein